MLRQARLLMFVLVLVLVRVLVIGIVLVLVIVIVIGLERTFDSKHEQEISILTGP